jgi:hypothetical protein
VLRLLVFALIAGLGACSSFKPPSCPAGQEAVVQELVYFGTAMPAGAVVSAGDWAQFLADTVTPRFPDGLSVWQAAGQWRSESGETVREASYVLNLTHADTPEANASVRELMAVYQDRFKQEAVLRVTSAACMSF